MRLYDAIDAHAANDHVYDILDDGQEYREAQVALRQGLDLDPSVKGTALDYRKHQPCHTHYGLSHFVHPYFAGVTWPLTDGVVPTSEAQHGEESE